MDVRPIRGEQDYRAALAEIDRLFNSEEGTDDFDRLDLLATLIKEYESRTCPIGPPEPLAAIEYEMEKRGLSRRDLEAILGRSGRVSEVLTGKRRLTLHMIRRLNTRLGISGDILIREYALTGGGDPTSLSPGR